MLRDIYFHGKIGQRFGKVFRMDVLTAAEAVRGISLQVPGFLEAIRDVEWRILRRHEGRNMDLGGRGVHMRLGQAKEVHFVPLLKGSKDRSTGKILLGVALAATAIIAAPAAASGTNGFLGKNLGASLFGGGITYGHVATLGGALILGGVADALTPTPQLDQYSSRDENPSYLFNGAANVSAQGVAVPLVYGLHRVGSVVASAGLTTEDIPV